MLEVDLLFTLQLIIYRNTCSDLRAVAPHLLKCSDILDVVVVLALSVGIHSFITEIYIAPLQGYYSEALPTLARLKRRVLTMVASGKRIIKACEKSPSKILEAL